MKAITLMQPWAGLMVMGQKKCETRSWNTKYRGQLAIHASAKIPKDGLNLIEWLKENHPMFKDPFFVDIITSKGLVLGHVNLVETHSTNGAIPDYWFERAVGNYEPGRFYWVCENPIVFGKPVEAKGKLSIWDWEQP